MCTNSCIHKKKKERKKERREKLKIPYSFQLRIQGFVLKCRRLSRISLVRHFPQSYKEQSHSLNPNSK